MRKIKIAAELNSCFRRRLSGNIAFEGQGALLETEYICCNSGILFLKVFEDGITPREVIEILSRCFNNSSELESILKGKNAIEPWEELEGIAVSVKNIPVLITRYSHNSQKIYNEWDRQMKIKEKLGDKTYRDTVYFG